MGFRGGSIAESIALLDLKRNADLVPVAFPTSRFSNTPEGNQGIGTGITERNYLYRNNLQRIRQTGLINGLKIKTGNSFLTNSSNLDTIELTIWRRNPANGLFDRVNVFNFTALFKALNADDAEFTINFGEGNGAFARKDDYYGLKMTMTTGNGAGVIKTHNVGSGNNIRFTDGIIATTGVDIDGTWTASDDIHKVQPLMQAPWGICVGDSLTQGEQNIAQDNGPWEDEASVVNSSITYPDKLEQLIGKPIQNSGLGGVSTINFVLANIQDRILDIKPKVALLMIGSNDAAQDTPISSYQTDYSSLLDLLESSGIIPVIIKTPPRSDLTDIRHENRTAMNDFLESEAIKRGHIIADYEGELGEIREDASQQYNFWNMKSGFNSGDNIHFNETGYDKIAQITSDILKQNQIISNILNSL